MNEPARISGKKLVWVGGIVLVCAAASARIFAVFYLRDTRNGAASEPAATTQATTGPAGQSTTNQSTGW